MSFMDIIKGDSLFGITKLRQKREGNSSGNAAFNSAISSGRVGVHGGLGKSRGSVESTFSESGSPYLGTSSIQNGGDSVNNGLATGRRVIISSNYIQLFPRSKYTNLGEIKNIEESKFDFPEETLVMAQDPTGTEGRSSADFEKGSARAENSQVEVVSRADFLIEDDSSTELPPVLESENLGEFVPEREFCFNEDKENNVLGQSLAANIPFSICISFLREERCLLGRRLHSIWKGYKTRCILRGSLKSLYGTEKIPSVRIFLGYSIHKNLISVIDLYGLIRDEESKEGQNNSAWLDALYEQLAEFKGQFILEVRNLMEGIGNRSWVSEICKAREKGERRILRPLWGGRGQVLPLRLERNYGKKTCEIESQTRGLSKTLMQAENERDSRCKNYPEYDRIYIPTQLVRSNSIDKISQYLNMDFTEILNIVEGNGRLGGGSQKGDGADPPIHQTPLSKKGLTTYYTPKSTVLGLRDDGEQGEFFTPVQEEAFSGGRESRLTKVPATSSFENLEQTENRGDCGKANIRPKPYLKRKSKSILPSRETDIEIDKITSKVRELYRGKTTEKTSRRTSAKGSGGCESGSRIPGTPLTLKRLTGSPSSGNSSSKASRIPRYVKGMTTTPRMIR
ncbi:IQ calmodulin-binding motif family protein [Cryptosporidium felis]|nr:IQ calmodulin-binding motif family protein [Cryptosporidium felis]